MIIGVGTDILSFSRFRSAVERRGVERWKLKILSNLEIEEFNRLPADDQNGQIRYLCGRFSLKESVYKASYPKYRLTWKEISILKLNSSPKPTVHFSADYPRLSGHVSLSHEDGLFVSTAVLEEP